MTKDGYKVADWALKIFLWGLVAWFFFMVGRTYGYTERDRQQEEWDCTIPYGRKPLSEVPVECLKYFDVEAK